MRAQWAGRPFLWHIYQQEEDAHMVKLDGFLDHYLSPLPAPAGRWLRRFNHALNRGNTPVNSGHNGRNTRPYGSNMGAPGHRGCWRTGISSRGW